MGAAYLSVFVGVLIGASICMFYTHKQLFMPFPKNKSSIPEVYTSIINIGAIIMLMVVFVLAGMSLLKLIGLDY